MDRGFITLAEVLPERKSACVLLDLRISHLKYLQYDWAREFPDYKTCLANDLSIDLLISNSHGPSICTLSMVIQNDDNLEKK